MHIKKIDLTNFRNYNRLSLELKPGITILQGANAQGKTNFLEAIYLLATTRSPFARSDRELVNWLVLEPPLPFAKVEALVSRGEEETRLELTIVGEANSAGEWRFRKKVRINGVNKKLADLLGCLRAVLFCPRDIDIIAGAPELRRRFLDIALCQIDARYCRALSLYNRIVEQRNHLLKRAREGELREDELLFWDEGLVEQGSIVTVTRWEALGNIAHWLRRIHKELTGGQEVLQAVYIPSALDEPIPPPRLISPASVEEIKTAFKGRLQATKQKEFEQGVTLVGPHRDDVRFMLDGHDVAIYGSRGQQRSAALSLRLAEMEFITAKSGDVPVLLLDEVMSELDAGRRGQLMKLISRAHQVVITTLEWEVFRQEFLSKASLFTVTEGIIKPYQHS